MPDTKLTWFNIKEHFRKCALIYIILIIVALVGTDLIWTTTAPRVPDEQKVLVYLADQLTHAEALNGLAADMLEKTRAVDETLQEVSFENLVFADPATDYTGVVVLMARLAAGEGDAFLASQAAMDALVNSGGCQPLDEYYEAGFMKDSGLEPYYATLTNEETGESRTFLAGFKVDTLDALMDMQAFYNEGAYLAVALNSTNLETTLKALEIMVADLEGGLPGA